MNDILLDIIDEKTTFFTDTLTLKTPYITTLTRNHESLFFVTKGNVLYEKNGEKAVVKKGDVGYVAKGSMDKTSAYKCKEVSYIAINFAFESKGNACLPFNTLCGKCAEKYESLFKSGLDNFLEKKPGYITVCNGILLQIIGMLYGENVIPQKNSAYYERIQPAITHIKNNYGNRDLQITDLSAVCNLNEKSFRRYFTKIFSVTPYSYLQSYRIEQADILLKYSAKTVSEIAEECGFSDIYSFSHCYKNHKGYSPNKQRNY